MHIITSEALLEVATNDRIKDDIIRGLIDHHPQIFMSLLHRDDLVYQVQQAYSPMGMNRPNKVAAIKQYRNLTKTSLKEAKLAVESMIVNKSLISGPAE